MSTKTLGVIDYGSGNLRSVCKAIEAAGATAPLITAASGLDNLDGIVVPGQGAFHQCAANLRASGLWDPVREWTLAGRPYLGICLGYQLLFESSEESPGVSGLGVLKGRVVRFPRGGALKVPHMGWNALKDVAGPLYGNFLSEVSMYFVHSFYPAPEDANVVSAWCDYGLRFAASVSFGAVHATQFHPEKSQSAGLSLLRHFISTL